MREYEDLSTQRLREKIGSARAMMNYFRRLVHAMEAELKIRGEEEA